MSLYVDIDKTLGSFHLQVQFEAQNGLLSLLGASGCGKSVTLKCIAGIERPDRGKIVLNGTTLFDSDLHIDVPPQKRRVGYLFQQYALFPNMTVRQNIRCGVRDKDNADAAIDDIIRKMHLVGLEQQRPSQLSGGQQQRTALARILVNEPEVLLLDEPFSALDSHLRFQLEREMLETVRRFGKPVLMVSHDRDEAFRLSDSIAVLNHGRIEVIGPKHTVFADPKTCTASILTGCKNNSPLQKLDERTVLATDWGMRLTLGQDVGDATFIGIRMHDLRYGDGENSFRCRLVEEIENPFSFTLMLRPVDKPDSVPIGWETDKETWNALRADELTVNLPKEHLLLLKD
ncbi:MAG: sulfate/molybdate ABC transporter ATP-binding protein [Oscillospiraceae bacterium]|nr:sulfate/molybdate ABC transporter ATP-binding protein [Oscillospiraceae bacterium]